MGWLRLAFFLYVGLTVIYFVTGIYSRSIRREKLEKHWDGDPETQDLSATERTAYIEDGMKHYDRGLKKRLLWLIYILPTVGFMAVIYVINWG